jgi:hydrogenase expression/formation protein HypC
MCLALPARVVALKPHEEAVIDLGGVRKTVSIALVPEAREGDYVIVHVGHAIGLVDAEEAEATLRLFAEMQDSVAADPASAPRVTPAGGALS